MIECFSDENIKSFFSSCSDDQDGKESMFYFVFQSKTISCLQWFAYEYSLHYPLTMINSLPFNLNCSYLSHHQTSQIDQYHSHHDHTIDLHRPIHLQISTDRYRMKRPIILPRVKEIFQSKSLHQRLIFYDQHQRELFVNLTISSSVEYRLTLHLSVPYILFNKTGLSRQNNRTTSFQLEIRPTTYKNSCS